MQLKVFTSLHRPKRYPCLHSARLALPPLRHAITAGAAGVVSLDASHTCHVCKSNMLPWLWQSCFTFALLFNLWCGIMQNQPTRRLSFFPPPPPLVSCSSLSLSSAAQFASFVYLFFLCCCIRCKFVSNLDDSPCKVSVKDLNEGY